MQQHNSANKKRFIQRAASLSPFQAQSTRLIYITQLSGSQISDEEKEMITWINEQIGERSWQGALFIFTDGDTVKPARRLSTVLKKRADMLRVAISEQTDWDIASSTSAITVNAPEDPLTTCREWLEGCLPVYASCTYLLILMGTREVFTLTIEPQSIEQHPCPQKALDLLPTSHHCTKAFLCFYFCIAPVAAIGLFTAGIVGCEIAILINIIVWMAISFLDIL